MLKAQPPVLFDGSPLTIEDVVALAYRLRVAQLDDKTRFASASRPVRTFWSACWPKMA